MTWSPERRFEGTLAEVTAGLAAFDVELRRAAEAAGHPESWHLTALLAARRVLTPFARLAALLGDASAFAFATNRRIALLVLPVLAGTTFWSMYYAVDPDAVMVARIWALVAAPVLLVHGAPRLSLRLDRRLRRLRTTLALHAGLSLTFHRLATARALLARLGPDAPTDGTVVVAVTLPLPLLDDSFGGVAALHSTVAVELGLVDGSRIALNAGCVGTPLVRRRVGLALRETASVRVTVPKTATIPEQVTLPSAPLPLRTAVDGRRVTVTGVLPRRTVRLTAEGMAELVGAPSGLLGGGDLLAVLGGVYGALGLRPTAD